MLWCQGAQNTGLSNRKVKSAQKCTVRSQCIARPYQRDRRTDGRTNIVAIARRFVLRTHRGLKTIQFFVEISCEMHKFQVNFKHEMQRQKTPSYWKCSLFINVNLDRLVIVSYMQFICCSTAYRRSEFVCIHYFFIVELLFCTFIVSSRVCHVDIKNLLTCLLACQSLTSCIVPKTDW